MINDDLATSKILLFECYDCHAVQYIPRNIHTVFASLCFVLVIHWLIFPYPSGLLHWHCGNLTIAPVPAKQPWWIWINISCGFIMNDCITTTKQSTTKPCAYFLGYTVWTSDYNPCSSDRSRMYDCRISKRLVIQCLNLPFHEKKFHITTQQFNRFLYIFLYETARIILQLKSYCIVEGY